MIKQKISIFLGLLVLFLLIVVLPSGSALAQEVNLCLDGTPTFNILSQRNISSWYQTASNTNDDNTGTKVGFDGYAEFGNQAYGKYEAIVEFAHLATVNKVNYYRYWYFFGKGWGKPSYSGYEKTYLYYGGAWHLIHTHNFGGSVNGEHTDTSLIEITTGGPWTDVSKVKIEAYMVVNTDGNTAGTMRHYTYELRAFGPSIVSPTVVTNDAADIQETSAVLNGDITDTGGENVSERGFEWGTSLGGPYPNSWTEPGSFGTGVFSHTITGLNSETTYYFRVKVYNSAGWGYGEEKSFTTASPPPCQVHNVYGWAYSENIGWISFSCENCDSDLNGFIDVACGGDNATTSSVDYGVDIDPVTGIFSGYAWSENIGWISFEPADLVSCPIAPCQAELDLSTGEVSGWARALAAADGWDGWIKLRGWTNEAVPQEYGVSLNSVPAPSEFEGWAWGDDVVGWISFNYKNCDTDSNGFIDVACGGDNETTAITTDYKVMTDVVINNPPTAAISCDPANCEAYYGEPLQLINDSTDPDGDTNIVRSTWCLDSYCPAYCDWSSKGNCTPQSEVGAGSYTAGLYIEDAAGESDTATKDFRIKRDITAGFMCSLDNAIWEVCENVIPIDGETVYFNDDLSLSEYSQSSEGAVINSRIWEKDEGVFDSDNNTNPSITASVPSMDIKLTVADSAGRSDPVTHIIGVAMPLPTWKEIVPF